LLACQQPALHGHAVAQGDVVRQDGAFEGGTGAEGGGAADLVEDVARLGAADQADVAGAAGDQGARGLEDPDPVARLPQLVGR